METVTIQGVEITEGGYLGVVDTAKLVRKALKREFPGFKFSVRSDSYSMGASIDVSWTDGPTEAQVDEIVSDYRGSRFDGMIDLKYGVAHWLTPDGVATVQRTYGHSYNGPQGNEEVTPERPEGAVAVHFGADYIHTRRTVTPEFLASLVPLVTDNGDGDANTERCNGCGGWEITHTYVVKIPRYSDDELWTEILCSVECATRKLARYTAAPA